MTEHYRDAGTGRFVTEDEAAARPSETVRESGKSGERKAALLDLIYEITHLSPMQVDGSHHCQISGDALARAREAVKDN